MVAGGPRNDCSACMAKLLGAPDDDEDDEEEEEEPPAPDAWPTRPPPPVACRMLASGELPAASIESGPPTGAEDDGASSSSSNKLLIADMAGLKPAIASGVSRSEGMSGAEKSRPRLSGFDNRLEARPPIALAAVACLSMAGFRTKNGA